jgi:hypothetical protein
MEVDPEADSTVKLNTESGPRYFCSESWRDAYAEQQADANLQDRPLTKI